LRVALIVFVVMAFAASGLLASAATPLRKVLSSPLVEEGSGPDGCTPAVSGLGGPAVWEVRVERLLLDGKGLVETSRQALQNRFPLCIADLPVAKNAEVELSYVAHQGGSARAAGIVMRFLDPLDFTVVEADALIGDVRVIRVVNGERYPIAERAAPMVRADQAQSLAVRVVDDAFDVMLDGQRLFAARDGRVATPGRFGIWSRADSATVFGDLFITVLD
jgi:hypothetical protein